MGVPNEPHGGALCDLYPSAPKAAERKSEARTYASWSLTPAQQCDVELILNGAYSPLTGFLGQADYDSVLASMRLESGLLWPVPVTLDVDPPTAAAAEPGSSLALRDPQGVLLAILDVEEHWRPDLVAEARALFGTDAREHPGVDALLREREATYLGGRLRAVERPTHHDFAALRATPAAWRARFAALGSQRVVAYQATTVMHRAEMELTSRAAADGDTTLFLQAVIAPTAAGTLDHFSRVRCYEHLLPRYAEGKAQLGLLELATRSAGPRETLWHALIQKNYGCTHFLVGHEADRACPPEGGEPARAEALYREHEEELGIRMQPVEELVYVSARDAFVPRPQVRDDERELTLSQAELHRRLREGEDIPSWFSYAEIIDELRKTHRPPGRRGFTVFFTGLSGSGKSTIAAALRVKLLEIGSRQVTLLDGDLVRRNLSSELGFSKEHRDLNIRRIGWVASEVTRHGGIAICAPIAPYAATRRAVRELVEAQGGFLEVYVSTPLEVCEARDRKGLYAKARAGLIEEFTGISAPYEEPVSAELTLDTQRLSPEDAAARVLAWLDAEGYLG